MQGKHHVFTIDGTTYYCLNARLFTPVIIDGDTLRVDHVGALDDHRVHLHNGRLMELDHDDYLDKVVGRPLESGPDVKRYTDVDEFDGAMPLVSVVPDGVNECPECGSWAGDADEEPQCIECGFGYDAEVNDG